MKRALLARLAAVPLLFAACTGGETSPAGIELLPRDLIGNLQSIVSSRFGLATDYAIFPSERGHGERLTTAHDWPDATGFESRALFRFRVAVLDSLPPDTDFGDVVLRLTFAAPIEDVEVAVHRVTSDWAEDGATWTQRDFGRPWSVPGGDFDPAPVARFTLAATERDTTGAAVLDSVRVALPTELLEGWRSGQLPNHGLILLQETQGTAVDFASRGTGGDNQEGPTLAIEAVVGGVAANLGLLAEADVFIATDESPFPPGGLVVRGVEPPRRTVLQPDLSDIPAGATISSFQLVMTIRAVDLPRDSMTIFLVPLQTEFRGASTVLGLTSLLSPFVIVRPTDQPGDTVVFEAPGLTALARRWTTTPATNRGVALRLPETGPTSEILLFGGVQFHGLDAPAALRPRFRAVVLPSPLGESP